VELRRRLLTFGGRRLKRERELPPGHRAIEHLLRQHDLLGSCRRKYQRKQDFAELKATWALVHQISADSKDLDNIPHHWP